MTAIDWTLSSRPDLGKVAWAAVSRCPHGEGTYYLFGRAELVMEQAEALGRVHRIKVGCDCPTGELAIKPAAPSGEGRP